MRGCTCPMGSFQTSVWGVGAVLDGSGATAGREAAREGIARRPQREDSPKDWIWRKEDS